MDKIIIRNLEVEAVLGVLPRERLAPRRVVVNIIAFCDTSAGGGSDDLADVIDYRRIRDRAVAVASSSTFFLVEALAEHIAEAILSIGGIKNVTVTVDKPGALESCDSVAIEITRP